MPIFPDRVIVGADSYLDAYVDELGKAWASVSRDAIRAAADLLAATVAADGAIFSCGNGGSAAIANHLQCDCLKGVQAGTRLKPRVHSLSSSPELISAIVNDIGVDEMFALPLRSLGKAGDVLIVISSSGASRNVVAALRTAKAMNIKVIALTGFDGGETAVEADISLHVAADNYGVVEDVHQSLTHVLAQHMRMSALVSTEDLGRVRF